MGPVNAAAAFRCARLPGEWSFSKKARRWSLQLKQQKTKRTVLYLILCRGRFLAAFALGEKAGLAAQGSGLPPAVLDIINQAPKYPEGSGVWLEVGSRKDLENVKKLAALKMAN